MLKNPTPEQILPAFCDAIELGGQIFAVDEIRGWVYCWDTANGIFSVRMLHCMIHCLNQ
jgi:hypothetical protein